MIDCIIYHLGRLANLEEYYMMWLSRVNGLSISKARLLLDYFKLPSSIWNASYDELAHVSGIGPHYAQKIISSKDADQLDEWIEELAEKEITYVSCQDPNYPALLKEIYDPPLGLYVKGVLPQDAIDKVSVVGARRCSEYGKRVTYQLAKDLAKVNIVVVSGMAVGIDTMSHLGALDGDGQTIAVLGCGVDVCYPAENAKLMDRIIANGCVISEYPPATPAYRGNFPVRNRIISGLSSIVVVAEAKKRSGSLITADQALDNGRDVFVIPGNVTSAYSEGTNNLIKQGCPIITNFKDVLFALGITYNDTEIKNYKKKMIERLTEEEKEVYHCISKEPITSEEIAQRLNRDIQSVHYLLSLLELSGYIQKLPQSGYVKAMD